ncbi:hypothetical protein JRI60_38130 [Archangium violaceum]|uniref:hypothetical protein n=1 Tax=Archangium violaceum TaxID=83451 RepID=UPI00194EE564|nr:hypothetical protein [Archangium violaceum]QRN94883.1 hypothetical protein JRI60_38130 [Archangium violaceum]
MNRFIAAASFFVAAQSLAAEPSASAQVEPKAAFERLKSLAGDWQGQAGHGDKSFPAVVTYKLASNGTVVMETLMPGTPHEMISMYHLDGGELVMTHYCAAGNQPRMKLDTAASTKDELKFAFVGGTNLDPAKDGHIHSGTLKFDGAALRADWSFWAGGKEQGHNLFDLKRSNAAAASATPPAAPARPQSPEKKK